MNLRIRSLPRLPKLLPVVLVLVALMLAGPAAAPPPAQASALIPVACDLAIEFNFLNVGFNIACSLALAFDCCDPTGDGWLDD